MAEWLISLRHRLRALLRGRQLEQDLADEVTCHLAMREEQLRASGAPDAGTGARRRFGSVTQVREDLREAWAFAPSLGSLLRDLRYAARLLRGSLTFTTVVVLTLGLGIGANTAFFSVVNAVLIRPLGYAGADRLVSVQEGFPQAGIDRLPFSALDFEDLRHDQQSFEAVAAYRTLPFEVSGGELPERIAGAKVSAELFATLGVGPMAGRTFSMADDRPGVNVVVLSWGLWQRRYAQNLDIVGQSIHLDRQPYTVIGIMPAGFVFPRRGPQFNGQPADVWVPIAFTDRERAERGSMHSNGVIARLKKDVSLPTARAELEVLGRRIGANYPAAIRDAGFSPQLVAQPLREAISAIEAVQTMDEHVSDVVAPQRFSTLLVGVFAAIALLLAAIGLYGLLAFTTAQRQKEIAVRMALGAERHAVMAMVIGQGARLVGAGLVIGLLASLAFSRTVASMLFQTSPHDLLAFAIIPTVLVPAALVACALPAWRAARIEPSAALRAE